MSAEHLATVRRVFNEAVNEGNLSIIDQVAASNYIYHEASVGDIAGPAGLKQLLGLYRDAFPDFHVVIEDQIDGGDKVVTRFKVTGTHRGELLGIAPTGRQVTVTGIMISRFDGGKVVEEWESYDALGMMQQLGAVPAIAATGTAKANR